MGISPWCLTQNPSTTNRTTNLSKLWYNFTSKYLSMYFWETKSTLLKVCIITMLLLYLRKMINYSLLSRNNCLSSNFFACSIKVFLKAVCLNNYPNMVYTLYLVAMSQVFLCFCFSINVSFPSDFPLCLALLFIW